MMEMDQSHLTERILDLTLEIIYLLTGENYEPVKKEASECSFGGWSQIPTIEPQPPPLTTDTSNSKKILEVIQKIIDLLTGEVPIRCQDVTVYFSMEEWEYLEGHKDLYKDVMMASQPPLIFPALSSVGSDSLISPSPNCMNEDNNIHINHFPAKCFPSEEKNMETLCEEEERVSYSDISTLTNIVQDMSIPIIEEHLLCEEHLPIPDISTPTCPTPSSAKKQALTAEEHHPNSNIFTPVHHRQSPTSPIKEGLLPAEKPPSHSNIASPADHIQYISIQIMEEQLPSGEMEHLQPISTATHYKQSASSDLKDDSLSAEEHVPHPDMSLSTDLTQSTPTHKGFISSGHVPHSDISTPADPIQYISIQIIEGPLSTEVEHFPHPDISTLTQSTPTEIKDEPPSAVEQLPHILRATHHVPSTTTDVKEEVSLAVEHLPHILMATHHVPCTTTDVKEEVPLAVEPLPHILPATHHVPCTTTDVKEEVLSVVEHCPHILLATHHMPSTTTDVKEEVLSAVEHLPHPRISTSTYCTHSKPSHVKEQSLSAPEHFPHQDSLRATFHMHSTPPHVKEEHLSTEEHLNTHACPTHSSCTQVKEEPFSCEGNQPSSCDIKPTGSIQITSNPIKEGSNACKKGSLTSTTELSCTKSSRGSPPRFSHPPPIMHTKQRPFVCGKCGRCYSIISNLELHMRTHTGDKLYKCWECGETFGEASLLAVHHQRHAAEKEHARSVRDHAENEPSSSTHGGNDLPKDQTFICSKCGGQFSSKSNLNLHAKLHIAVKPFCCPECGKGFTRKCALNKHWKYHMGDKPSVCLECGRFFNRQADLTRHMTVHTRRKHYCCSKCGKCFRRKTALLKHRQIHSKLPEEEEDSRPTGGEKDSDGISHETL
ncbi:uncharacterized protein [Aquarana catesbeiana]|uniref:uncharacterized protein n=1 Tax=Aquarana catesbeiana TaxID=8400 RepID=UPI003CC9F49A